MESRQEVDPEEMRLKAKERGFSDVRVSQASDSYRFNACIQDFTNV